MRPSRSISIPRAGLVAMAAIFAGCAKPTVSIPETVVQVNEYEQARKRIVADPIAFLEESLAESRKLKAFTTTFERQERLGLLRELKPTEHIAADYRDQPFSVRFTWMDPDSEYNQCIYVRGQHDNKVVLLPRKGPIGQPAAVQAYPPSFAVLFAKARNPITDFGPRRMMERILLRIANANRVGDVSITLGEPKEIGPKKEPCYYLELRYPPGDEFPCKLQDLYISTRTRLPVATYLWLPGKVERCGETLDAMYVYGGLEAHDQLADCHFEIVRETKHGLAGIDENTTSMGERKDLSTTDPAVDGASGGE